jgi:hypothetical protein
MITRDYIVSIRRFVPKQLIWNVVAFSTQTKKRK